ncbi:MAG: NlpC/P60 family protein [Bacteroidales bacterium]|jgi:cell wall-associated NlpC family hydrolase
MIKSDRRTFFVTLAFICSFILLMMTGCRKPVTGYLQDEIDSISLLYAPDKREAVFEAGIYSKGKNMILKGETDLPQAREAVIRMLDERKISFIDSMSLVPDYELVAKPWGVVNVSVSIMRSSPSYSSEQVSQTLMGTPVKILKSEKGWFLIQSPDYYLGWVDNDAIQTLSDEDFNEWKNSPRLFYLKKTGEVFRDPSSGSVISDIVAGCIVAVKGQQGKFFRIQMPDGREGYLPANEAVNLDNWLDSTDPVPENLRKTAESLMGIPYWWGGASVKGCDCSGFVKTVYFLNGIILARDASLQYRHGIMMTADAWPDSLIIGDLLFFGRTVDGNPRATHVGMYIGDSEYIHCAGMVRVNSLDSTRGNFSRSRLDTFLGARRIAGTESGRGTQRVSEHNWYR